MTAALDRPVWASLTTVHAPLAQGDARAWRFAPDVNVFAAARDDGDDARAALAALVPAGDRVYVLQVPPIAIPRGVVAVTQAAGVQLVATRPMPALADADIEPLGDADAAEMLALATLTEPGPFRARTHRMGRFVGIRRGGRLVAMAGERMRFPGYTEVSGVCTHPDARGAGLARRLSAAVAAHIERRGERPFLHTWASNTAAIRLYESLGFVARAEVAVAVLARA